jgi:hypothetical protein
MLSSSARKAGADAAMRSETAAALPAVSRTPQVNQMALCRQLARAPDVARRHARSAELVGPGNHHVVRDDVTVLQREHVQRTKELVALENQRHRERTPAPRGAERRARRQVAEREALYEREAVDQARRGGRFRQTVGDQREQALAEYPPQIVCQRVERLALGTAQCS